MTETVVDGPGPRHAFAPYPEPAEGVLFLIHVLLEESCGRMSATSTDTCNDRIWRWRLRGSLK